MKTYEEKAAGDDRSKILDPKHEGNAYGDSSENEPRSEFIVWWNEPHDQDPANPMNWSSTKKWMNIGLISVISFLV